MLRMTQLPIPVPTEGQVLVKVLAFGINRAGIRFPYLLYQ